MADIRIHFLGWLVVGWATAAQQPAAPTVTATSTFRVEAGQDVFFASDHLTGMRLVHLRKDGTFAEYAREHMFVGLVDRGRWRQDGDDVLCQHTPKRALQRHTFTRQRMHKREHRRARFRDRQKAPSSVHGDSRPRPRRFFPAR